MGQLAINILISSFLYLVVASGFNLIYYTSRILNLSFAISITLSPLILYSLHNELSFSLVVLIPISIILTAVLNVILEILIFSKLNKKGTPPLQQLIASLGIYIILYNVISIIWGNDNKTFNFINSTYNILEGNITKIQVINLLIFLVLFLTLIFFLRFSKIGKKIRAINSNAKLSEIYGIDHNKIAIICTIFSAVFCSTAGIFIALDYGISNSMGFDLLLSGIVVIIISGANSFGKLILGAFLLSLAHHVGAFIFDSKWIDLITYVTLIVLLMFRPMGLSGKQLKKTEI